MDGQCESSLVGAWATAGCILGKSAWERGVPREAHLVFDLASGTRSCDGFWTDFEPAPMCARKRHAQARALEYACYLGFSSAGAPLGFLLEAFSLATGGFGVLYL